MILLAMQSNGNRILHTIDYKTCIVQDFKFYDDREANMKAERQKEQARASTAGSKPPAAKKPGAGKGKATA